MCGIVGVMTTEPIRYGSDLYKYFKQALFADTLRGVDSTGVAVIDTKKGGSPEIFKKALAAPDFLQLKQTEDLLSDANDWNVMIGHNRAATKGGIKHSTAHPFQIGDTTLVHNGTVYNHRQLLGGNAFDVDSEAITNAVELEGIEEVVKTVNGAFTLVWHDAVDQSVNFIRNKERPMWVGVTKDRKTVLFASEGNMLQWLAIRNKFNLDLVYQLDEGVHYKYNVGEDKDWATNPTETKLPLYQAPVSRYPVGGTQHGQKKTHSGGKDTSTTGITTNPRETFLANTIKRLGMASRDDVVVVPKRWVPFASSNVNHTGVLHCKVRGNVTQHDVTIYDVSENQAKVLLDQFIVGNLISATTTKGISVMTMNKQTIKGFTDLTELNSYLDTLQGKGAKGSKKKKEDEPSVEGKEDETSPDDELVRGPGESVITRALFKELVDKGCDVCGTEISGSEADETEWTRDSKPVCAYCAMQYGSHITH